MTLDRMTKRRASKIDLECLVALTPGTQVHATPEQSYVRAARSMGAKRRSDLWIVNNTAAHLLAACDGGRSVLSVVESEQKRTGSQVDLNDVCEFFSNAVSHRHVEVVDFPRPDATSRITGSFDYYIPLHIAVELTTACNQNCSYCYNAFEEQERDIEFLPANDLLNILERWRQRGLMGIELTGGEPLLYDGFWDVFDYAVEHFDPFAVLTNGLLVDDGVAERMAAAAPKLVVSVSLDGPTAEVHERTRGKGTFTLAVAAIRRLASRGVSVRPAMTVDRHNIMELERTVEFAKSLGARFFGYGPISPFGRGKDLAWGWDWRRAEEIAEMEARVLEANRGFIAVIDDPEGRESYEVNCGAGHKNVVLSPTGSIAHCLFADRSVYLGNLREQSIDEVFSQPIFSFLHSLKEPNLDSCQDCHYGVYCRGCTLRPLTVFAREGKVCEWATRNDLLPWIAPEMQDWPCVDGGRFICRS